MKPKINPQENIVNKPKISTDFPCPFCKNPVQPNSKFCSECGQKLTPGIQKTFEQKRGEKRLLTVMFTDVTGYTSMVEILDPEEIQELLRNIYKVSKNVVDQYEGVVHEIIGDCAVILFGEPSAKEDDSIRAVLAAQGIHEAVKNLSTPALEAKIGRTLTMHTGVNTGTVLVGYDELTDQRRIFGDAVNIAARLDSIAGADEIVVSKHTYQSTKNVFNFDTLDPQSLKGKSEAQEAFRLIGQKEMKGMIEHASLTKFIGREKELALLQNAVDGLDQKDLPQLITLHSEPGGGKTRLVNEWKSLTVDTDVKWVEAGAYSISRNTTYALWVDFFKRISVNQNQRSFSKQVEDIFTQIGMPISEAKWISWIDGKSNEAVKHMDVALLKENLFSSVLSFCNQLSEQHKSIFIFEDLHWADQSSIELYKYVIEHLRNPAIIVGVHRSNFPLFTIGGGQKGIFPHVDINLFPLTDSQGVAMLQSLLKTVEVPQELVQYVREKISGNPYYIEEFVGHLLDSKKLIKNGKWKLTANLHEENVPNTIEGVIRAKIDRLELNTKRLMEQASVIGRSFYFDILKKVADANAMLEYELSDLEKNDIILAHLDKPCSEYSFRHALTQEITYNSMLKNDRSTIHFKVAQSIENHFQNEIHEYYEILAHHYVEAQETESAVKYLILAGQKKLAELASIEADEYFKKAYELVTRAIAESLIDPEILFKVLIQWSFVLYDRGKMLTLVEVFENHRALLEEQDDHQTKAWYYGWLSMAKSITLQDGNEVYELGQKSIIEAELSRDPKTKAYIYAWYSSNCGTLVKDNVKAVEYGLKAIELSEKFPNDYYLIAKSRFGTGICQTVNGQWQSAHRTLTNCVELGKKVQSPRVVSLAYGALSTFHLHKGEYEQAAKFGTMAGDAAPDNLYSTFGYGMSVFAYSLIPNIEMMDSQQSKLAKIEGAELPSFEILERCADGNKKIENGKIKEGYNQIQSVIQNLRAQNFEIFYMEAQFVLGKLLSKISSEKKLPPISHVVNNFSFLLKFFPQLNKKIVEAFTEVIDISNKNGAAGMECQAAEFLGKHFQKRKNPKKAEYYLNHAIQLVKKLEMPERLEQLTTQMGSVIQH